MHESPSDCITISATKNLGLFCNCIDTLLEQQIKLVLKSFVGIGIFPPSRNRIKRNCAVLPVLPIDLLLFKKEITKRPNVLFPAVSLRFE